LYFAEMVRLDPPPLELLVPLQPANAAAAIRNNARPAYAYCFRRAASLTAIRKLNIASTAASHASKTNGVARGRKSTNPGGRDESVVVNAAVHEAPTNVPELFVVAPAGVHVAAAPRLLLPFKNCTVPVGPCAELLFELTVAVNVTFPPDVMLVTLGVTAVDVVACVIVTDNELLPVCEL